MTGNKKKRQKSARKKKEKEGKSQIPMPLILGGAIVLVVAGLFFFQNSANQQMQNNSDVPVYSDQVQQVAGNFMCPCGECDDNLALCTCTAPNGSVDVKGFIQEGLAQGKSVEQMITAVQLKYNAELDESKRY
ncbi:MAG: hypothetical protein GF372_08150 [Candidatus Marinimicrobia bacterium]|nr:hypothetical protein [Candidatus Neomarinimicrobiota bacterium]